MLATERIVYDIVRRSQWAIRAYSCESAQILSLLLRVMRRQILRAPYGQLLRVMRRQVLGYYGLDKVQYFQCLSGGRLQFGMTPRVHP